MLAWGREKTAVALEDAQFSLGQGPGPNAVTDGAPVLEPDLALAEAVARYPAFTPAAANLRVRAVFAFPLRIGAISVGVLTAHRTVPGPLTVAQLADALALADAVTVLLLHQDPRRSQANGASRKQPRPGLTQPATHRAQVHQATGMISVQLGVSLAEALVRLRARAYARTDSSTTSPMTWWLGDCASTHQTPDHPEPPPPCSRASGEHTWRCAA